VGKSYSQDLRKRIVGDESHGQSCREPPRRFGRRARLSASRAIKRVQRVAMTGSASRATNAGAAFRRASLR
jgi:transposase